MPDGNLTRKSSFPDSRRKYRSLDTHICTHTHTPCFQGQGQGQVIITSSRFVESATPISLSPEVSSIIGLFSGTQRGEIRFRLFNSQFEFLTRGRMTNSPAASSIGIRGFSLGNHIFDPIDLFALSARHHRPFVSYRNHYHHFKESFGNIRRRSHTRFIAYTICDNRIVAFRRLAQRKRFLCHCATLPS